MGNFFQRFGELFRRPAPRVTARYELKPHRSNSDARDGNSTVYDVGPKLRQYARHLDQNHDLVKGALDRLTQFIVGPNGISVEPQPRTFGGEVHTEFAAQLLEAWRDWAQKPEVTWTHDWAACQRLLCRSWLRDGEALISLIFGNRPDLDHGTRVPFSVELIEADFLPFNNSDTNGLRILQSVELNGWNRPIAYWLYKEHPGGLLRTDYKLKRVSADSLLHLKLTDRIGQIRGVCKFASALQRMNGIYKYETAEMVAAEIAASLTGALKTENASIGPSNELEGPRTFDIQPGMILDNLRPGESLDIFSSNRPSATVEPFRNGQLRAASAGFGLSYSAMSRDYNGTYSAQRQELVEQFDAYRILSNQFISQVARPVWQRFVTSAIAAGVVRQPRDLDPLTLDDASYQPPVIPWIDPLRESNANNAMLENYLTSPQTLIRQRGGNPDEVLNNWQQWKAKLAARNLTPPASNQPANPPSRPVDAGMPPYLPPYLMDA